MDDDAPGEFTEVKPSNWNKNKRNKPSSANTPIPSYSPTTPWPTYSPTTLEDKAEWLKRKQKYLKNRDKVPESVWETDEATVGPKKLAWLEKQKDKKNNKSNNESNTEKEEAVANSDKLGAKDQQQEEEKAAIPTPTPSYYDPPLLPTKKQKQLEKREKRDKLAAQQQNTTADNEASDSVAPTVAPSILDSVSPSYSPSGAPTVGDIISTAQQEVPAIPTQRRKKQAEKEAQLAEETTKPSDSPTMSRVSSTTNGRYTGGSRQPPRSRNPPVVADAKGNETDVTVEEAKEESEPAVQETNEGPEPQILETTEEPESVPDDSKNNEKKTSTSEKVSLILAPEDLEKPAAAVVRDASRPTLAPVEPTKTVKVNFTFTNNRAKKRHTPAPTPAGTSAEPTYIMFPTLAPTPTDRHPTYLPTASWTWKPTVSRSRSKIKEETSLFDKRTCASDLFFESELRSAAETGESVFFTYGIQTSKDGDIEEAVEKIQLWLLEDVARKLLHCSRNAIDFGLKDGQGVLSSVYYSQDDRQYAKQCNPTTSEANMCAIVSSTLRFEAVDEETKAKPKVLAVIFNQLQSGFDARLDTADILDLAYMGPELGYQQPQDDFEVKDTNTSSSSIPTSAYAAIGVASVAVFALLLCLAMGCKLRKERRRPTSSSPVTSSYRDVVSHHDDNYSYTPSDSRRSYYR